MSGLFFSSGWTKARTSADEDSDDIGLISGSICTIIPIAPSNGELRADFQHFWKRIQRNRNACDGLAHPKMFDTIMKTAIQNSALALAATFILILAGQASHAQDTPWAARMFEETSHDFGVVAKGAAVEFAFVLENIYEQDVHIRRVSSSCGCTNPRITNNTLRTGETGEVLAVIDTRHFSKRKGATLTVEFDRPQPAVVHLRVDVYIRTDVVFEPGQVEFGTVIQGETTTTPMKLYYAGRSDWRISAIYTASDFVYVTATETERRYSSSTGAYTVAYDIDVQLKPEAPEGYINEPIRFVTNDVNSSAANFVIPVHGLVTPPVTARPSPLLLGLLDPGESSTRNLVVRAGSPFRVSDIRCEDPRFHFEVDSDAKSIQVVQVSFDGAMLPEQFSVPFQIVTDLSPEEEIEVTAVGRVIDESPTGPSPPSVIDEPDVIQPFRPLEATPLPPGSVIPPLGETESLPSVTEPESPVVRASESAPRSVSSISPMPPSLVGRAPSEMYR